MGAPPAKEPSADLPWATDDPGLLGKRILVVDDEQCVRQAIALLLRLDKHRVVEAANGAEALGLFHPGHFDLVITDLQMPQMKGNELAARIRRLWPTQRVLMITAYAERIDQSKCPVDAILDKPFQLVDLRRAMARLLA